MADLIVKGDLILTQNQAGGIIKSGAVAVSGSKILAVGPADQIEAEHGLGARVLKTGRGLVMPGLINSHTHVAMTCLRGLADDLPLMAWLEENIFPAESRLTGEMVYWGALLGCAEMILSGTTCFCDMYLFEHEVIRAVEKAGLRALVGEVLYDFPSPNYGSPEEGLKFTESLIEKYRGHERVGLAVEPHTLYTCSPGLLQACRDLSEKHGVPLITHLAESRAEVETIREKYGTTPVRHLEDLGLLSPNLIADHCVVLDEDEIELLARRGVRAVHNPASNMKLASGVAPVPGLLAAGVPVGLGTDGPASNNNLDLFGEMDIAAKMHKVFKMDPTVMAADTVLNMATGMGAKVLGLGGQVGRLSPGFLADMIVLDLDQPHLTPLYNPVGLLVYAASGADVVHSVVHGRILMEDRRLTCLDLEEIYEHMSEISKVMAGAIKK
ncbi:MAG: amidohydrolase [Thermodesulfobacteriota bacterium]|nr:amidohydrolase [Thermodesulfobacteriota bacterium]